MVAQVSGTHRVEQAAPQLHDRCHLRTPSFARGPDHDGVEHGGMALQRLLHLFGEDLFASGVDRHRATPVDGNRPIGHEFGHVPGDGVADASDDREGGGGLGFVLVIADRDVPAGGQHAHPAVSRFAQGAVVGNDHVGRVHGEDRGPVLALAGQCTLPARLRGTEGIHHQYVGKHGIERLLDRRGQDGPSRPVDQQLRQVELVRSIGLEVVHDRTGIGVADGHDHPHLFLCHDPEREPRIEAHVTDEDAVGAREQRRKGDPPAPAVHQRAQSDRARKRVLAPGSGGDVVEGCHRLDTKERIAAAAHHREVDVLVAPHHTLGHAGRATGPQPVEVARPAVGYHESLGRFGGEQLLVTVVGHHHRARPSEPLGRTLGPVFEVGLGHHELQISVVEQVVELFVDVPEVDVDRHRPHLEGGQGELDVLVAVIEVASDEVPGADPEADQRVRQLVGPGVELGKGEPHLVPRRRSDDQGRCVRRGVDHCFENVGEVQSCHGPPRAQVYIDRTKRGVPNSSVFDGRIALLPRLYAKLSSTVPQAGSALAMSEPGTDSERWGVECRRRCRPSSRPP